MLTFRRLDVPIGMNNYATHKTPKIKAWLARVAALSCPSVGSLNSPEGKSSEVFTPPSGGSRRTCVPSSTRTTKTRTLSNGPSLPTRFWLASNASATKPTKLYAVNFRFT